MFKPETLRRVQNAMNTATQVITVQEQQTAKAYQKDGAEPVALQSYAERQQAIMGLARLMLEEDDRQDRRLIVAPSSALKI